PHPPRPRVRGQVSIVHAVAHPYRGVLGQGIPLNNVFGQKVHLSAAAILTATNRISLVQEHDRLVLAGVIYLPRDHLSPPEMAISPVRSIRMCERANATGAVMCFIASLSHIPILLEALGL